jgi:2-methylcitrate dehydratase PrpD
MLLNDLAARICALRFQDLPAAAVVTAKEAILDTIGVTLAGAHDETTEVVARTMMPLAGSGNALIYGSRQRTDMMTAAIINGTASHALDFDDCSNTIGGHPSAPILPALLALADERGATGADFITAYAAGVECETKIARAVNFHHYEKGWHPTATLGTFGSAAACGLLLRLDADAMARALALATSMASGIKANFGTMTKPFHVGQSSRAGLLAALLAKNGMTANPDALEHPQGFFAVYNGKENVQPERILAEWGRPFDLDDPGIAFKRHPCCGSTHPAIDAMLALRERHGLTVDAVREVRSFTHPRRLNHTNRPNPVSGLDGKFSVQYVLARALMHGIVSLDHFSDAAVKAADVRSVMAKISAAPDPDARMDTTDHFYARVIVTIRSGDVHEIFVDRPIGRDRAHPLPAGALEAKFRDCARRSQDDRSIARLQDSILALEKLADVAQLGEMLAEGTSHAREKTARMPAASAAVA